MNLADKVQELWRFAQAHQHSGDDAHLPATTDQAGFATSDMYDGWAALFKNRPWVKDATDILTLPAGFWAVPHAVNSPLPQQPSGSWLVDVTITEDGEKLILAQQPYAASRWMLEIRPTGFNTSVMPNVWQQFGTSAILFIGAASGIGTSIALADAAKKFNGLKIYYKLFGTSGVADWTAFYATSYSHKPDASISFTAYNLTDTDATWYSALIECGLIMTDDTHAKINKCKFMNQSMDGGAAVVNTNDADFMITAIIGYN